MSEGDKSVPSEKRVVRYTAKGLVYHVEKMRAGRRAKCKQAGKYLKRLQVLMESNENVNEVQRELSKFIKSYAEARYEHEYF